jgi:hypothetical protein
MPVSSLGDRRHRGKHVHVILTKLDLAEAGDDHRRVLAAITFLEARYRPTRS